jgi:hypothetical protein
LAAGTQATYIDAVRKLAAHYRRSPDRLTDEKVRAYIIGKKNPRNLPRAGGGKLLVRRPAPKALQIAAAVIGNALEW